MSPVIPVGSQERILWHIGWPSLAAVGPSLSKFFISNFRWCVIAGSVNTVWDAKLSSSSTNCSSFPLGLSVGAHKSASAVSWCLPGTCWTVALNLISLRQNHWICGDVLDNLVVLNKVWSGLWSVSRTKFMPTIYSLNFLQAHTAANASLSITT